MERLERLVLTIVVWTAFTVVSALGLAYVKPVDGDEGLLLGFVVILGIIAYAATRTILKTGQHVQTSVMTSRGKAKRDHESRVTLLLELLSDDELDSLRRRLSADDGETVSLEELLQEQRQRDS